MKHVQGAVGTELVLWIWEETSLRQTCSTVELCLSLEDQTSHKPAESSQAAALMGGQGSPQL